MIVTVKDPVLTDTEDWLIYTWNKKNIFIKARKDITTIYYYLCFITVKLKLG